MPYIPTFSPLSIIAVLLLTAASVNANEVVSIDGREIRLNRDGTWEFLSEDRLANTPEGRRVRLKPDNTWEYIGNAPLKSDHQLRTETSDILLTKAEVHSYEEKAHKSKRVITQTLFYLTIDISPLAKTNAQLSAGDLSKIIVRDNTGTVYPLLQVTPDQASLKPGSKTQLIIRADGAPSWFNAVKTIELTLPEGFVSDTPSVTLSEHYADMEIIRVESLPEW